MPGNLIPAETYKINSLLAMLNILGPHRRFKIRLQKMHMLLRHHTNLHDLDIVLHRIRFPKIDPRLAMEPLVPFWLDANRLFCDTLAKKQCRRRRETVTCVDDAMVVDEQAGLESTLFAVGLDRNALAECAFWVHDNEAADFCVGGFAPSHDAEVCGAAGLTWVRLAGWFYPEHLEDLQCG
jgi:hypothetical protein